jgi:hypothetical protein
MAEAERLRQSLLADAGRGDLLKTIIAYRLEQMGRAPSERSADDPVARPAHAGRSAPEPTARLRLHPRVSAADQAPRVEMRFAIDAPDPSATNPDPVLLTEVKRARRCFDALVSGRIGSVAELASLEGISDRYEAVASVVI